MEHTKKTNISFEIKFSLILNLLSLLFKLMFGISTPLFHKKIRVNNINEIQIGEYINEIQIEDKNIS